MISESAQSRFMNPVNFGIKLAANIYSGSNTILNFKPALNIKSPSLANNNPTFIKNLSPVSSIHSSVDETVETGPKPGVNLPGTKPRVSNQQAPTKFSPNKIASKPGPSTQSSLPDGDSQEVEKKF